MDPIVREAEQLLLGARDDSLPWEVRDAARERAAELVPEILAAGYLVETAGKTVGPREYPIYLRQTGETITAVQQSPSYLEGPDIWEVTAEQAVALSQSYLRIRAPGEILSLRAVWSDLEDQDVEAV